MLAGMPMWIPTFAAPLALVHGDHASLDLVALFLHVLQPAHLAVPVLAVAAGLLAVRTVRVAGEREHAAAGSDERDARG